MTRLPRQGLSSGVPRVCSAVVSAAGAPVRCGGCGRVLPLGRRIYCNGSCRAKAPELRRLTAVATQALGQLVDETVVALLPEQRTPDLLALFERLRAGLPERLASIAGQRGSLP